MSYPLPIWKPSAPPSCNSSWSSVIFAQFHQRVARRCGNPTVIAPNQRSRPRSAASSRPQSQRQVRCRVLCKPPAFRKAQREVAAFHQMRSLSAELIALNEQICRLRPVEPDARVGPHRKKNECCNSSGNHARSREPVAQSFCERRRAVASIWKPSRWPSARPCTAPVLPPRPIPAVHPPTRDQRWLPCVCGQQHNTQNCEPSKW